MYKSKKMGHFILPPISSTNSNNLLPKPRLQSVLQIQQQQQMKSQNVQPVRLVPVPVHQTYLIIQPVQFKPKVQTYLMIQPFIIRDGVQAHHQAKFYGRIHKKPVQLRFKSNVISNQIPEFVKCVLCNKMILKNKKNLHDQYCCFDLTNVTN